MKNRFTFETSPLLLLALVIILGAGAGIVATVLTSRALDNYTANLLDDRRFIALAPKNVLALPGTYEESLEILREDSWRSLAIILPASPDSVLATQWLRGDASRGLGVVVSSDGWVLTTSALVPTTFDRTSVDVWVEKQRFTIEKVVRDTASPLVLIKLAGATQLPAVGFGAAESLESADMLFAVEGDRALEPVVLKEADHEELFGAQKAEAFTTDWRLSDSLLAGTPLFASSGELLGFSTGEDTALPLHHSRGFVQDVVRTGSARYPGFGAYLVDLSRVYNIGPEVRAGRSAGALVLSPGSGIPAILSDSPAQAAGILSRDIILDVDGEAITAQQSFAEIIAEYDPGEIANLRLVRNGEVMEVAVTLGELKDLVY